MAGPWEKYQVPAAAAAPAPAAGPAPWLKYQTAPASQDDGALAAGVSGLAHGLSFQGSDKIIAGAKAGYDKLTGGGDFGPNYDKYLAEQKAHSAKQAADHPVAYHGAEIAGAVFNPANALIPGGGLLGNIAGGAIAGAAQGAGESNAHPTDSYEDLKQFGGDVAKGAGYGAVGGTVATGLGHALQSVPGALKKGAAVFLGAPEDAVERYLANPEAVKSAPSLVDSVASVKDKLASLKSTVGQDSQASRAILDSPTAQKYTGKDLSDFFGNKIAEISAKGQGTLTPEESNTVNYLKKYQDVFANSPNEYSGSRIKDVIQEIDRNVKYGKMPGAFDAPQEAVLKDVRSQMNERLRTDTPAYAGAMDGLSQKASTLNQAQALFKSDQGLSNTLNRVRRDRAPFAEDALTNLDAQFPGANTVDSLRDSLAKEAFDKGANTPGGSRNVQLYRHVLGDALEKQHIPGGQAVGAAAGAVVDKYGPKIAQGGLDAYIGAKNLAMNPTVASYLQAIQNGAQATQLSPDMSPAISQYLINKYMGGSQP